MEELTPNTTLSHYRIISKLGAGGMGEVYLAQDTSELGRTVALKILPSEVAKDKDRLQRFTQEARTVSNLNHPNILTIHEFGQTKSASFIAMEYVDGVTLRQHQSKRRLKLVDVLDVAIQFVAGLNAAHEAGVTHRDLKPENIMIRLDHIVKVLDFGLAKPTASATQDPIDHPNVAQNHYGYALNFLLPQNRLDEAISEVKRALDLEPLSIPMGANLAGIYIYARKNDLALEQAKKVLALEPNHVTAQIWMIRALCANGRYAEAIALFETTLATDPSTRYLTPILGYAYAKSGRKREALEVVRQHVQLGTRQFVGTYEIAAVYIALGENDKAFEELEKAYISRDWGIARLSVDPFVDPLRDDPRFKDLVRRMKLPE